MIKLKTKKSAPTITNYNSSLYITAEVKISNISLLIGILNKLHSSKLHS